MLTNLHLSPKVLIIVDRMSFCAKTGTVFEKIRNVMVWMIVEMDQMSRVVVSELFKICIDTVLQLIKLTGDTVMILR